MVTAAWLLAMGVVFLFAEFGLKATELDGINTISFCRAKKSPSLTKELARLTVYL